MNTKIKKRRKKQGFFNLGLIIYSFLLIYLIVSVVKFTSKKSTTILEVKDEKITDIDTFRGIILREETLIKSSTKGYIHYFAREGDKQRKNNIVCVISKEKDLKGSLAAKNNDQEQNKRIQQLILDFKNEFNTNNFDRTYDFSYQLRNALLSSKNTIIDGKEKVNQSNIPFSDLKIISTPKSGIVSYTIDGYEEYTPNKLNINDFKNQLSTKYLLTNQSVEKNSYIYKIISSQDFKILFPANKKILNYINQGHKKLKIRCMDTNNKLIAQVSNIISKDDMQLIELTINNNLLPYIYKRFVNFEIVYKDIKGIKIPNSSIIKKEYLKIPKNYVTQKDNKKGVLKETIIDNKKTIQFCKLKNFFTDKDYYYIPEKNIKYNDILTNTINKKEKSYQINEKETILGVYNCNKGYAKFSRINILYSNENYSIVEGNIQLYDYIVVDITNVRENEFVF